MNTVSINQFKSAHYRNKVVWSAVGIFMTISIVSAIVGVNWTFLAIAAAPLLIYLFIMRPFVFIFGLYCFLVPFDSILLVGGGATITKLLGIATILALFMTGIFEKKIMKPDKMAMWWGFFVVFGVLSIFWAIRPEMMYHRIATALGLFLMYLVISSYRVSVKDFETVKKFIIYGGIAASIYTTFTYFFAGVKYYGTERASLSAGEQEADPNLFAYSLLIPFALTFSAALTERKRLVKVLDWAFLGTIAFAILITGSRGALLGTITIVLTFLFSKGRKHLLIPTVVISLIMVQFLPDMVFERISQSVETGGAGRLVIWGAGIDAIKYFWLSGYYGLVGIGLDNFPTIYSQFGPASYLGSAPHNIYLGTMVELGIIGFLFMIIAIYKHYAFTAAKYYRHDPNSVFLKAVLFGSLMSALFVDVVWKKSFWLIWMLIIMYRNVKKERSHIEGA